jgi:hypothetical protein
MESEVLSREWGDRLVRAFQESALPPRSVSTKRVEELLEALKQTLGPVQAVPSVIVPQELNFLINPALPRFAELKWSTQEPFRFDPRTISPSFR